MSRREAALQQEREERAARELDGCTFRPSRDPGRGAEPSSASAALTVPDDGWRPFAVGIDDFVARQRQARAAKEAAAAPAACSWTGRATVPVEFSFQTHERGAIRALKRPIEYAPGATPATTPAAAAAAISSLGSAPFGAPCPSPPDGVVGRCSGGEADDDAGTTAPGTPLTGDGAASLGARGFAHVAPEHPFGAHRG